MPLTLSTDLVAAVREGRAVLFLGAGASRGATDIKGHEPPDAKGLASLLAADFLGPGYDGFDLRSVYDLACSERDVRTVQKRIAEILEPFQPSEFHKLIPSFPWAGLATTNYDLLIERAYEQVRSPAKLIPNVRDKDGATDRLDGSSVLYVKLHGCITRYQEVEPPLIASTEQLISFRNGRSGQFDTFMEWAKTKTVIFCGYSFLDMNLRILFDEIIKDGDNRPRHYIVNKGAKPPEIGYWRDRRVIVTDSTFKEFLEALDASISTNQRALGAVISPKLKTSFSRFITTSGATESEALQRYLGGLIEHVPPDLVVDNGLPKRFYSGFDLGWFPFAAELDIRQPVVEEISRDYIRTDHSSKLPIVLIKGHAGSGKTVSLRRICYDAATKSEKLCFYVSRHHKIIVERFDEIFSLTTVPVYLFVDGVSNHRKDLVELIALSRKCRANLRIIATEMYHIWNVLCDDLEPLVSDAFEMRYLSEPNIIRLLEKLEANDSLGYLASMSANKRADELKYIHGRQILVALLEATHGTPLINIIKDEYESIEPVEARRIYLDICSLHRFGPPVRAGLIARIHDVSFEDFEERFFEPLEAIVTLRKDARSGDYVYEARHSFIAHELYNAVLTDQDERFDNIVRVINKLNPSFSYDQEVMSRIIRSENLRDTLNDPARIRQVYDVAAASFGKTAVICQQRGIFEAGVASSLGMLVEAERWLKLALELDPYNRAIKHSLAELDLKKSRLAETREEREQWRKSAVSQAGVLTSKSTNPYPHHTLLKAAIDRVKDALADAEEQQSEGATQTLSEAIAHAEDTLRKGRQAFPNEAILQSEEGQLSNVLSQAERAETAFERAFKSNPRSTLIAKRLARIKRAKGVYSTAAEILRKCLEYNPGSADIHYDLGLTIIESAPNADQLESDSILYHLRRAFTPGDKNYQAQFWYARQLVIAGRFDEARPMFKALADARIPFREKLEVRGIIRCANGEPQQKDAVVSLWRETWGFVSIFNPDFQAFLSLPDSIQEIADYIAVGTPVRCNIGFTLRGPVVIDPML